MRPAELVALLQEFYLERLALLAAHEASARHAAEYDVNNTYQYIIAREETHLGWLSDAIRGLDAQVPDAPASLAGSSEPSTTPAADAKSATEFVERWSPRVQSVTNARHLNVLKVILGETLEHRRFFEQAAAGREDLLGRQAPGAGQGTVLPARWVE